MKRFSNPAIESDVHDIQIARSAARHARPLDTHRIDELRNRLARVLFQNVATDVPSLTLLELNELIRSLNEEPPDPASRSTARLSHPGIVAVRTRTPGGRPAVSKAAGLPPGFGSL